MTLVVGDVKARVKRQFGDESGVQITDDDIYRWISDALRNLILNGNEEIMQVSSTLDIVANQQDYTLPDGLIALKQVQIKNFDSVGYFQSNGYSLEEFTTYVDGWDGSFFGTGNPAIYTVFDNTIKFFPIPDANSTAGIKLYYTSYLTEITDDTSSIDVPPFYFNVVVNYCLQQAYQLDEDWIAAEIMMQQIAADLKKGRGKVNQRQETYSVITILDDDRW